MQDGVEAVHEHYAADCLWVDARTGFGAVCEGRDAALEYLRATREVIGDEEFEVFEVIAERGERLSLIRQGIDGDIQVEMLTVTEYDAGGQNIYVRFLDVDALGEALLELDDRFASGEGAGDAEILALVRAWERVIREQDVNAFAELLAPDLQVLDHRRLGSGVVDREGWIAWTTSRIGLGAGVAYCSFLRVDGRVLLTRIDTRTVAAGHSAMWSAWGVWVADEDFTSWRSMDVFDDDDRASAQARFEELAAPQAELENLAARRGRAFIAQWMSGGAESLRGLVADDVRYEDRRAGLGSSLKGPDAAIANLRATQDMLGLAEFRVFEIVVQRGDRLALFHQGVKSDIEVGMLTIAEFTADGLQCFCSTYDEDDLAGALDELEERYAAGEGAEHAMSITVTSQARRAATEGHVALLDTLLADQFVSVDHRPLGFGTRDRRGFIETAAARLDTLGLGVMVCPVVLRIERGCILAPFDVRSRTRRGVETTQAGFVLSQVRDGKLLRMELLADDDLDTANVRFETLIADHDDGG